jgi:hypothetical protein
VSLSLGKIDRAYAALADRLGAALFAAGFLAEGQGLAVDPVEAVEPDPEPEAETEDVANHASASLVKLETRPVRTILGGPTARYVVERSCQLELAAASHDTAWKDQVLQRALGRVAGIPVADPTLGGTAERVEISGAESDGLAVNGESAVIAFTVRVRSGDPLGLSD